VPFTNIVSLKFVGLSLATVNGDAKIATSLRESMAKLLNVDLSLVGTPTFTETTAMTTTTATAIQQRRRVLSPAVSATMSVTTLGYTSSTSSSQLLSTLQSTTAQSNLLTYFSSSYGAGNPLASVTIGAVSASDSTPTTAPTKTPLQAASSDAVAIAALVLVCTLLGATAVFFIVFKSGIIQKECSSASTKGNAEIAMKTEYSKAPTSDQLITPADQDTSAIALSVNPATVPLSTA